MIPVIALFLCFSGGGWHNVTDEPGDASIRQPYCVAYAARQDDANHMAILEIHRASAGSWPRDPVYHHRESTAIGGGHVSADGADRTYRDGVAQGESAERYGSSIWRYGAINLHWCDGQFCPVGESQAVAENGTVGKIELGVPLAQLASEQGVMNSKSRPVDMPYTVLGYIDGRCWARRRTILGGQCVDDMICCNKGTIGRDKESRPLDRTQVPISSGMNLNAHDGRDRMFHGSDSVQEVIRSWRWRGLWQQRIAAGAAPDQNQTGEGGGGSGFVHNDGSFWGKCVIEVDRDRRDYQCER